MKGVGDILLSKEPDTVYAFSKINRSNSVYHQHMARRTEFIINIFGGSSSENCRHVILDRRVSVYLWTLEIQPQGV